MNEFKCTYLFPIKAGSIEPQKIEELRHYWTKLNRLGCEVLVVDGSEEEIFRHHEKAWTNCRHIGVDPRYTFLNGKVNGLITGVLAAGHELIIMGDDDIRYEPEDIQRMLDGLGEYDLVKPQNYFDPNPFWTRIDTGRILLNRAYFPEGDFPGTFGFRRSVFLAAWPYDGDVLFDNEEVVKHLQNRGARILFDRDFFIRRLPPNLNKWIEQRPRQAYEDFIMKKRTAFFLSCLPALGLLGALKGKKAAGMLGLVIAGFSVLKAQKGRNKKVARYLPAYTPFYAPLWVLERSLSIYLALYWKIAKGGYPFGDRIISKGTGKAWTEGKQEDVLLRKSKPEMGAKY